MILVLVDGYSWSNSKPGLFDSSATSLPEHFEAETVRMVFWSELVVSVSSFSSSLFFEKEEVHYH